MNVEILNKVRLQILGESGRFFMGAYFTELGWSRSCGCIAVHAISVSEDKSIEELSKEADRTPIGYEREKAQEYLEITKEQGQLLFFLDSWPVEFRCKYRLAKHTAAAARIEHFIKTNGVE